MRIFDEIVLNMKYIYTLLLALIVSPVFAQIQLDKNDLPKLLTPYHLFEGYGDNLDEWSDSFDLGASGADASYDFRYVDSLLLDSVTLFFRSPNDFFGFGNAHPSSNMAVRTESETQTYRPPLSFDSTDYPAPGDSAKRTYYSSYSSSLQRHINDTAILINDGNQSFYDFRMVESFDLDTSIHTDFEDPSAGRWSGQFPNARVSAIRELETDTNGDTLVAIHHFYHVDQNGHFRMNGVGIKLDEGVLSQSGHTGNYQYKNARVREPLLSHISNLELGESGMDSAVWRAQASSGFTELRHFDLTIQSYRVSDIGTLYMPDDSFQVSVMQRMEMHFSFDSIFIFGTLASVELDTNRSYYVSFYTKGNPEPVLELETGAHFYSINSMSTLDNRSSTGFTSLRTDTVQRMYAFFNKTDSTVAMTGISAILDEGALGNGNPTGRLDTLHAPFNGQQLIMSTNYGDGFSNYDSTDWSVTFEINNPQGEFKVDHREQTYRTINYDGYGTLYLSSDTVQVLKMKVTDSIVESNTMFFNGVEMDEEVDTFTEYYVEYYAKMAGFSLVKVVTDAQFETIYSLEFMEAPDKPIGKEELKPEAYAIYPNPSTGLFRVALGTTRAQISVYDINGRLVQNESGANGDYLLDLSNAPKGLYIVTIKPQQQDKTARTYRLIKQ